MNVVGDGYEKGDGDGDVDRMEVLTTRDALEAWRGPYTRGSVHARLVGSGVKYPELVMLTA